MATLFSRIIAGEIPCQKIHEDEGFFAFLDINPINPGHTLVVPKVEVDEMFQLEDEVLSRLLLFARPVAAAIQEATACRRVGMLVAGLEVPHAHLHLVPITGEGDLTFARARSASPDELVAMGARIRACLAP